MTRDCRPGLGELKLVVGSHDAIPGSPEAPPRNAFQYVDYPAVSLGPDGGDDYVVVFQVHGCGPTRRHPTPPDATRPN